MRIKDKETAMRILTSEKSSQDVKNQAAQWLSEKYNTSIRDELIMKGLIKRR